MTVVPTTDHATCEDCGREMNPNVGCTMTHVSKGKRGKLVKRVFYGEEDDDWGAGDRPCHDCNAAAGTPHHAGCDVERCPECGHQMLGCFGADGFSEELAALMGGEPCGWTHLYSTKK